MALIVGFRRVRVVTWNVARRVSRIAEQAMGLAEREPDVIALQEVTRRTVGLWRAALETIALPHVLCSLDDADPRREPANRRSTGVLIAAREDVEPTERLLVPWPETTLAITFGGVRVDTVHVPNAANGWVKVRTLQALREGVGGGPPGPRIVCGDFNVPRREHPDGTVISFASDSHEKLRADRGVEWDAAELGVVPGLGDFGWRDAFRTVHGYARREPSWTFRRMGGHDGGWRLDHLFVSPEFDVTGSRYHHGWRDADLSDHAALEADVKLR